MDRENIEAWCLAVLNGYGMEILDDPARFISALVDVSANKIKKIKVIHLILDKRFLQFFKEIDRADSTLTTVAVSNATSYICDQYGVGVKLAEDTSIGLAHAVEEYQGFPKTLIGGPQVPANNAPQDSREREKNNAEREPVTTPPNPLKNRLKKVAIGLAVISLIDLIPILILENPFKKDDLTLKEEITPSITETQSSTPTEAVSVNPTTTQALSTTAELSQEEYGFVMDRYIAAKNLYMGTFLYQYNLDENDTIEGDTDYGYRPYNRVLIADTEQELLEYTKRYYTATEAERIVKSHRYIEHDGKLYIEPTLGVGDSGIYKVELSVVRNSDTQLTVTAMDYYSYYQPDVGYPRELHLIKENGNWVWDQPIQDDMTSEVLFKT